LSVLLLPVFIVVAIAIKFNSRGPVIFKQMRIGQHQREFECYKFRTMHYDNDESLHEKLIEQLMTQGKEQREVSIKFYEKMNEKRITQVGRILRIFKLDELPQMWNVIKGDMSLVGPRPAIYYEIKYHDRHMLRRFNVKSGISGFWQVQNRSPIDYRQMVAMDLYYVDNWSLFFDFKIILKTIPALIRMAILRIRSGSIFENSSSILLTKMSLSFSSMIITVFMARKLGPDQLGLFSVAMGLCNIFQLISILGYDSIVVREIAKDQNKGGLLIQNGVVLGIISSAVGAFLMGFVGRSLNYSPIIIKSVYLSSIVLFPCFLNLLAENIFIGLKKARYAFYNAIVREMTWLLLSVCWLSMGKDYNAVIEAFIVSRIMGVILLAFFLRREQIHWWKGFHWHGFKETINLIPTFFFINLSSNLLLEIDIIILSKMVPVADVGFYSVAKKILRGGFMLIFSMISALFPSIVENIHQSRSHILFYFKKLTLRMFIINFSIATVVCILAHTIIILFMGHAFIPSVRFIHVLIWKIVPLAFVFLWSRFLLAANQQNKELLALMTGLPLFLITSVLFVRMWGAVGMAYADVLTISLLALIHLYFVNRTIFRFGEKP